MRSDLGNVRSPIPRLFQNGMPASGLFALVDSAFIGASRTFVVRGIGAICGQTGGYPPSSQAHGPPIGC